MFSSHFPPWHNYSNSLLKSDLWHSNLVFRLKFIAAEFSWLICYQFMNCQSRFIIHFLIRLWSISLIDCFRIWSISSFHLAKFRRKIYTKGILEWSILFRICINCQSRWKFHLSKFWYQYFVCWWSKSLFICESLYLQLICSF